MGGIEPTKRDIPCTCQCDTVKLGVEQQRALVRHHLVFLDLDEQKTLLIARPCPFYLFAFCLVHSKLLQ